MLKSKVKVSCWVTASIQVLFVKNGDVVFNQNSPLHNGRRENGGSDGRSQQGQVLAGSVNGVRRAEERFLLSCVSVFFGGLGAHIQSQSEESGGGGGGARASEER